MRRHISWVEYKLLDNDLKLFVKISKWLLILLILSNSLWIIFK